ncbi:uncharacterized protein RJT20DRAFT_17468 [Scheffersomyces xylosifermentans]|uniref:uncharacterized protein n=1 Tax=Scheffersomyces xylosifermentans TaxID=1304137 RepID=UPI00315C9FF5
MKNESTPAVHEDGTKTTTFNKNATPFIPSSYPTHINTVNSGPNSSNSSGYSGSGSSGSTSLNTQGIPQRTNANKLYSQHHQQVQSYYPYTLYYVHFANLPTSITKQNLVELIDSIIQTSLMEFDPNSTVYQIIRFNHDPAERSNKDQDKSSDNEEDPESENLSGSTSAVLETANWNFCIKLIEILNGYEWLQKILDVKLTGSPSTDFVNQSKDGSSLINSPLIYNPYHALATNPGYVSGLPNSGISGGASGHVIGPQPPPVAQPGQQQRSLSASYEYNNPLFGHHNISNQQQQHLLHRPHHLPPIPHQFQVPPHLLGGLMPLQPGYGSGIGATPNPPGIHTPPRQYSSRRSSSSKSFESRKTSRTNSFTSKNSISSASTTSLSGGSSGANVSTGYANKQPVPHFIMNMVNNRSKSKSGDSTLDDSSENSPTTEDRVDLGDEQSISLEDRDVQQGDELERNEEVEYNPDQEPPFIFIRDEEEGEIIKVNPCRLFIGNVPYSSNWASLKKFMVTRSRELDPTANISILRVEIPMQSISPGSTSVGSEDGYQAYMRTQRSASFDESFYGHSNPIQGDIHHQIQPILPQPLLSKSRGFAIVTTGNRQSSDKLIEMFDNMEFEGRSLTVRYDKFPDYNNYVIQQLFPSAGTSPSSSAYSTPTSSISASNSSNILSSYNYNPKYNPRGNSYHVGQVGGSSVISNLAFERNSFQQKFYYGGNNTGAPILPTGGPGYLFYPYYFNSNNPQHPHGIVPPALAPDGSYQLYNMHSPLPPQFGGPGVPSDPALIKEETPPPPQSASDGNEDKPRSLDEPQLSSSGSHKVSRSKREEELFKKSQLEMSDEERARELVNSFSDLAVGTGPK